MAAILFPYGIASTCYFPLIGSGTAAFSASGSGSLVGTNIYVSKDGGALGTSTNTGTYVGSGLYSLVLTTSELSAKQVAVLVGLGTLGTVVEHQAVLVQTYGNASAMFPFDFGTALSAQTVGTATTVLGGTVGTVTGTVPANVTQVAGTAVAGSAGTLLVNLVANQATATIGTVSFLATGTVTTVTNPASANLVQVLGTAVVATAGTLTNVGTAGTALGTLNANLVAILGTGVVGTGGTLTNVGTVGTALGTLSANLVAILGTAALATAGTLTNIGTAGTALGTLNADVLLIKGTAAAGTGGTLIVNLAPNQATATLGVVNTVGTLGAQAKADVNAEVLDVVNVDTFAELGVGALAAAPTQRQALMALYMSLRNKITVDGTWKTFFNDGGTATHKKAVSDDGTVYTEAESTSG